MIADTGINNLLKQFKYYFDEDDPEKIKALNEKISAYYKRNNLMNTKNYACYLYDLSLFYAARGEYAHCYNPAKNALAIAEKLYEPKIQAIFTAHLGVVSIKLGKKTIGARLLKKCYNLIFNEKNIRLFSDLDKADICINLGSSFYDSGDYDSALRYHIKALGFRNEKDDEYANNLNLIGYDYEKLGETDKAIGYLKSAAELIESLYSREDIDYIANLSYLASVYKSVGDSESALEEYNKVLYLLNLAGFSEEPFGGELLNRVAEVCSDTGDDKRALELRMKALGIFEKNLGVKNIFYANCLREIARIYRRHGLYGKALSNLQRDLEIKGSLMSAEENEYFGDAKLLSKVYEENGQEDRSVDVLEYLLENIAPSHKNYRGLLLDIIGKYIDRRDTGKLYELYEKYRKTDPTVTFDELLVMAEKKRKK